jgi:leucyl-tRNA synthetase
MSSYNHIEIQKKWKKRWDESKIYSTNLNEETQKNYYNLVMFPYPSGDKLHIGHWYNYSMTDSWGRYVRLHGHNVFQPMGYDSFGLPAENYAIKTGVPPHESIKKNTDYMTTQLSDIGAMWDWEKSVVTSSPEYYKWTQWVFLQMYKKGLAYKKNSPVNWCEDCKTVLANEQVSNGACERCGNEVIQKKLNQWFWNIRSYAEELLNHDGLDWPEKTKLMQKNWIGKSVGSDIVFAVADTDLTFDVFTTRPDTLFGCSYCVLAPEHELVEKITKEEYKGQVDDYLKETAKKTDMDRSAEGKEKTGVFTGSYAINPINGEKVPIWIADYVVAHYGTGAVMAVPAHDERDFEFATKYKLPISTVIQGADGEIEENCAFTDYGILVDSGEFEGLTSEEAKQKITEKLKSKNLGDFKVSYKLRDWLVSRQRYWGAPIPIVYCDKCGEVPVPEEDLPIKLPTENVDYKPKGKSPLASVPDFVNTKCPKCEGEAKREVDTMDTFVCSSWYFLRYLTPHDENKPFDKDLIKKWLPVDMYIGGPEHACMHLLYSRFVYKVLMEDAKAEPFARLIHQGLVTKDGAKMSKSKGNVVSPDEFVNKYGSDVFRMYLMFMGPFTEGGDWNDSGIMGLVRFVDKFWRLIFESSSPSDEKNALDKNLHKLIKKVTEDVEKFHFNTALAGFMEFLNFAVKNGVDDESKKILSVLIAPFAPHLAEECWEFLGEEYSVFDQTWPKFDENLAKDDLIKIGVQVNGKVRGEIEVSEDMSKDEVLDLAKKISTVEKYLVDSELVKEIYVPGRIVGFVVK